VNHFKLLRVALCEKRINPLADISRVFFLSNSRRVLGGKARPLAMATIVSKLGTLFPRSTSPPEVSSDIASLRRVFEAEFRRLSKFSDPLCE
jgi:hypothetical protein